MKIYLLEKNQETAAALEAAFVNEDVEVVCDLFADFMLTHDVECVVSPANSYGLMDGGYDKAITEWFGSQLQERVQKYISEHYYGEQPVGTSFIIDAGRSGQKLIHTPTMRVPSRILDPAVVYQSMRTTLMVALENDVKSIVIPVFGGLTGGVEPTLAAKMMWLGYDSIVRPNTRIGWGIAWEKDDKWVRLGVKR